MTLVPVIEREDVDYTRLQALAWASGAMADLSTLNDQAAKLLARIVGRARTVPLVVECKGVSRIADHAFDDVALDITSAARPVLFVGGSRALMRQIEDGLQAPNTRYAHE